MRHLLTTLLVLTGLAAVTCLATFWMSGDPSVRAAVEKRNAMEWLRADFALTDAQFAKIKKLHDSYSVVCEKHCMDIMHATRARNELKASPSVDATATAAADKRVEELRLICEMAIAAHVRQCAAEMSPSARDRYLALVLPKIADFDHQAPPDLQLNQRRH